MPKILQRTLVPIAVVALVAASACGKSDSRSQTAMNADLAKDLQLATQTQTMQINPDEVAPESHQEMAAKPKEAPRGPRLIRSHHPTIKASPKAAAVAALPKAVPDVQVMASAPAPVAPVAAAPAPADNSSGDDAPPLARPSNDPGAESGRGSARGRGEGEGQGGSVGGSILGGIIGAVIRGGVGDGDHCDPRPPRTGRPIGGDMGGVIGTVIGGMGGARGWP